VRTRSPMTSSMSAHEKRASRRHKAYPIITNEFMEFDRPCGGLGLEVRRSISETKRRHNCNFVRGMSKLLGERGT
jgi:hypothetical protein